MAIQSTSFGRVTLTGADADKFIKQAVYGRPKSAAHETVKRGCELARRFQSEGKLILQAS